METVAIEEMLKRLALRKEWGSLTQLLSEMNPSDAAKALECVPVEQLCELFWRLNKDLSAEIFSYMDSDLSVAIVQQFLQPNNPAQSSPEAAGNAADKLGDIINEMPADDAADMVDDLQDELPANLVSAILKEVDNDRRAEINAILKYPENSAGSIMTTEYIMLLEDLTASAALEQIRKRGADKETIYNCYAVDKTRKLTGAVSLRDIILNKPTSLIRDFMTTPVIFAKTHEDQEAVAARFKEYDLIAMPVVDGNQRIVGIITIDDVVDVIEAENTEDMEKMAALRPSEDEYLKTGIFQLARNRLVWLLFLMISATFTGAVIGHFQELLTSAAYLAAFIPMLMDTGGNCGAQASTLVIRGMAVGEIALTDVLRVVWRELRVGSVVAIVLTGVNWLRMHFLSGNLNLGSVSRSRVEFVVCMTLFVTIILAKLIGCLLPMFAKKLRFDPALMAAPMLTTIVDAVTLIIFFTVAGTLIHLG